MDIPGHRLIRTDHPSNDKGGGVCVYFKSSLPIQILSLSMLHECINFDIRIDGKLCNLTKGMYGITHYLTKGMYGMYANTAQIKSALASSNWEHAFSNSSIDKKVSILNETIINVMSNCISQ